MLLLAPLFAQGMSSASSFNDAVANPPGYHARSALFPPAFHRFARITRFAGRGARCHGCRTERTTLSRDRHYRSNGVERRKM